MTARPTSYLTTPIYYVNDVPHIGHAYTTLAVDVLARFLRLDGHDVHFLTGTDEHGLKIQRAAEAAGLAPQAFCDQVSARFRGAAEQLGFTHDDFIRTTEPRHRAAVQALWRRLADRGQIYLGSYAGWYAVRDEAYYAEDETEVVDGKRRALASGAEVAWVEEPSYFFRLSDWTDRLLAFYEANPDFIAPTSRRNEVISFVKRGLQDLSVSRTSFTWGVPVPDDPGHVIYVWLDALANYITAVGFPDTDSPMWKRWWPASLHMIGKDILRFHAIFWPAFLMAADLPPPRRLFVHGWWTIEGRKMSKSLGNAIDPLTISAKYGRDQFRYFLMRELPFGADGDYSHAMMVKRMNTDLANDLGNLAQRVLAMIAKNLAGRVPEAGAASDADQALLDAARALLPRVREQFTEQGFHRGLEAIWEVVSRANRYIDEQAPWTLRKTDAVRFGTVLVTLVEVIRHLAILVQPVVPDAAARLLDQLAVPSDARTFTHLDPAHAVAPGTSLPSPEGVFPRWVEPAPVEG
jgi:methionyl-tRNA synthetase